MQIDSNEATGHSKNTLSEAIANAIGEAMAGVNGDHQVSLTVVVDGYEFDGKEYRVKVRVMVLDRTKESLEHSEELAKKDEEASRDLANEMTAAIYDTQSYESDEDQFAHIFHHYLHDMGGNMDKIDNVTLMAHPATHEHLNMEAGVHATQKPEPHAERSYDAPEPNMMGGGGRHTHTDAS